MQRNMGQRPERCSDAPRIGGMSEQQETTGTTRVKRGMAEMLKGGVIMDVVTPEQAKIAEDAGAVAVMALERVPADIRAQGGVSRMSDPDMIDGIIEAVSIPVMAKARIGHFAEAQIRSLKTLNNALATRTFLVNERISLADISVAAVIQHGLTVTIDAPIRAQIPNVIRHFETVVNQPQLKDIFGQTEYIEKALAYTPPPK